MSEKKIGQATDQEAPKDKLAVSYGSLFYRRQGAELLNPVKARIRLSLSSGHLYEMKGRFAITASGYAYLNKAASINVLMPRTIVVDGREMPNPHIERNPDTKAIETANVRKIGIGYSPVGNITIVDKAVFYNVYTYLIQSIQAKMKSADYKRKKGEKVEDCAVIGTKEDRPKEGKWAWFPTAPPLGLWVNYEHPDIQSVLEDHTQRQRFGDRIAQRIVERNILRDHPAIAVGQVTPEIDGQNAYATIEVYAWRHLHSAQEVNDFLAKAEAEGIIQATEAEAVDLDEEEIVRGEVVVEETAAAPEKKEGSNGKSGG